jgi:hypothetical protein
MRSSAAASFPHLYLLSSLQASDQITLTYALEVEALGLVLAAAAAANTTGARPPSTLQGLLQEWAAGQAHLATLSAGLTSAQQTAINRLQQKTAVQADALSAAVSEFAAGGLLGGVQITSKTYRGTLEELRAELGKRRRQDGSVVIALTWMLTLLGVGTVLLLVLGVLRSVTEMMEKVVAINEEVVREKVK